MVLLRTETMMTRYREHQKLHSGGGCALCHKEALRSFKKWKILDNDFPYDLITSEHHMLVPIRHVTELELDSDELKELSEIKTKLFEEHYDFVMEASTKNKSIPSHFHLHLVVIKQMN